MNGESEARSRSKTMNMSAACTAAVQLADAPRTGHCECDVRNERLDRERCRARRIRHERRGERHERKDADEDPIALLRERSVGSLRSREQQPTAAEDQQLEHENERDVVPQA